MTILTKRGNIFIKKIKLYKLCQEYGLSSTKAYPLKQLINVGFLNSLNENHDRHTKEKTKNNKLVMQKIINANIRTSDIRQFNGLTLIVLVIKAP